MKPHQTLMVAIVLLFALYAVAGFDGRVADVEDRVADLEAADVEQDRWTSKVADLAVETSCSDSALAVVVAGLVGVELTTTTSAVGDPCEGER